jgi:AraC family transcriptional regulator, transcriptional activator of pobA
VFIPGGGDGAAVLRYGKFPNLLVMNESALELMNPQSKHVQFKWYAFGDGEPFREVSRFNCFTVLLVLEGRGSVVADVSEFPFFDHSLLCFSLYQPFRIKPDGVFRGIMINFHPEFFCLHKHRHEVSCNGVLFNNVYESPVLGLSEAEFASLLTIVDGMGAELRRPGIAQSEALLSYLKLLLINASRMKMERRPGALRSEVGQSVASGVAMKEPEVLGRLKAAIEERFASLHSPGDYAGLLNISTAALNKVVKACLDKTLSQLIAERIVVEAKRQLYLTAKPVKQIAFELGYDDEFYFSRFFKGNVGVSPQYFRDTVGVDRANA